MFLSLDSSECQVVVQRQGKFSHGHTCPCEKLILNKKSPIAGRSFELLVSVHSLRCGEDLFSHSDKPVETPDAGGERQRLRRGVLYAKATIIVLCLAIQLAYGGSDAPSLACPGQRVAALECECEGLFFPTLSLAHLGWSSAADPPIRANLVGPTTLFSAEVGNVNLLPGEMDDRYGPPTPSAGPAAFRGIYRLLLPTDSKPK